MSEVRLIDANALKEKVNAFYDKLFVGCVSSDLVTYASGVDGIIDTAPTIEPEVYMTAKDYNLYMEGYKQGRKDFEKPQAENNSENALLKDIAHSLAIIADNSAKEGNTQESGNETLHWVHSEAHRVMCPKCGCRVSINAAYEMNYCFKCGAKLGGIKNDNS